MVYNWSMADIDIRELLWDTVNESYIWERHQLTKDLVEEACYGDSQYIKVVSTYNNRYLVIAPLQNKRLLAIVLAPQSGGRHYPVSARIASKKERREYREWKAERES